MKKRRQNLHKLRTAENEKMQPIANIKVYRNEIINFNPIHLSRYKKLLVFHAKGPGGYALCKPFFQVSDQDKLGKILLVDVHRQCLLLRLRIYASSACCFRMNSRRVLAYKAICLYGLSKTYRGATVHFNRKIYEKNFVNRQEFCIFTI